MSSPKITVLLPVWNGERFLQEALQSVWRQTFRDFELLVIDDGSTDSTPDILAACRDSRLRVLRNEPQKKLIATLNLGITESRGEWIARMDADDRMRPDRLQRQMEFLNRHPDCDICGGWVKTFGAGRPEILKYPTSHIAIQTFTFFYNPFAHPTVMFRRNSILSAKLSYSKDDSSAEDYGLWAQAVFQLKCANLPRVLCDYRLHPESVTGAKWDEMNRQTMRIQKGMLAHIGLQATDEEIRIHREASLGVLSALENSFTQTNSWLQKIQEANERTRKLDPGALADILNYVWFRMAMGVVRSMGMDAWRLYRNGAFSRSGSHCCQRSWLVRAAAWKAFLLDRRK